MEVSKSLTPTWMTRAACAHITDRSIFFEEKRSTLVREAKKLCMDCVVRADCFDHAVKNHEVGVWGGTTTNERAKYLRVQKRVQARAGLQECSNVAVHGAEEVKEGT